MENTGLNPQWEYGRFYKNYNMDGVIELPNNSQLQVHDLMHGLPNFMKRADVIFCDPPCNTGNLRSFYTKSDMDLDYKYDLFVHALFNSIDAVKPKYLFLEVFKSNKDTFHSLVKMRYKNTLILDSMYYNKKNNKCWIIIASNSKLSATYYEQLNGMDEEKIIKWICEHHEYNCIGDFCMGQGLVGKYAFLSNRSFVGTELNKKRLAKLVHFIKTYQTNV